MPGLEVHAANDPAARARVVVLDEVLAIPSSAKALCAEGLEEEAALVAVDGGRDQDGAGEPGLERLHRLS